MKAALLIAAKKVLGASYRTSFFGACAIAWGLWLARVHWVPGQTLYFNLVYALPTAELFVLIGFGLLCARDHKTSSEDAGLKTG